jgi:RNA polymerase sigma factor (TIGR02999 family)
MNEIADRLAEVSRRDSSALEQAFATHYAELKRIAHARLRGGHLDGQLQTTALLHESFLKLTAGPAREFPDRVHFLAYASRTLRSIVIDFAREQRAQRRGGGHEMVTLDTAVRDGLEPDVDIEAVSDALDDLAKLDEGLARLVEMRFFAGLTEAEIAEAMGCSERTVRREWNKARALLLSLLAV